VRKHLEFINAPKGVVAFRLKDYAGRDDWRNIIVILNSTRQQQQINVPQGYYDVVCREGVINEKGIDLIIGNQVFVAPQSALIIHN
jgi:pullulanase